MCRSLRQLRFLTGFIAVFVGALCSAAPPPHQPSFQAPVGFEVIQVAAPPLVSGAMLGGFDERGRLFVAESTGLNLDQDALAEQTPNRIRMLEDVDGDGMFDRSTIFADKLTFPQGAQWLDGALYVASPPSIWRFEDTDGDGKADVRTEIVSGFKYTGNAADVHGPFLHPNGRLYWCHGRKGHEVYQRDGSLVSKGLGARVWSCRPDGTDIQVHAGGGMDNPTLLTANQEGDLFGLVNIFQSGPRSDAVLHWIYGAVYPRPDQEQVSAEFKRTGSLLSAAALLGHVAPAGTTILKTEAWGPDCRGNLFLAEFNTHRVMRVVLEQTGATYRGHSEPFVSSTDPNVHFTDVIEDADGSMLVIDTGAWFRRGCPTSGVAKPDILGAIYRVRRIGIEPTRDPRGLSISWAVLPAAALSELLADPRPAVRERAMSELARKGDAAIEALDSALGDSRYLSRSNAVWALTRIGSPKAQTVARRALADVDARVRQAACQSAFVTIDQGAFNPLVRCLRDAAAPVRREAARSLGRLRNPAAIASLGEASAATEGDPALTHALVYALIEIGGPTGLRSLLAHADAKARRAALIALDQISPGSLAADVVFAALKSAEPSLRAAAADIAVKHIEWAREAADYLAIAFDHSADGGPVDAFRARILSAFLPSPEVRAWLRARISSTDEANRIDARTFVDAVANARGLWDESWRAPLIAAFESSDVSLGSAALRAIAAHPDRDFSPVLRRVARETSRPGAFRVAVLQVAAGKDQSLDEHSFQMLIEPFVTGGSPDARLQAATVLHNSRLNRQHLLKLAALLPAASPVELSRLLGAFRRGSADPEVAKTLLANISNAPGRWGLTGQDLQVLFRRFPAPASEEAAPMISEIMNQTVAKDTRVLELEKTTAGGDVARGRAAFLAGAGACVSCHQIGGVGGRLGPDLSQIGRIRSTRDLLEGIAFPNATIARGYETFHLVSAEGGSLTGTIARETAETVFIATSDGHEVSVPRASIRKLDPVSISLMPAGLDRAMAPEVFADLLAFLKSLQ